MPKREGTAHGKSVVTYERLTNASLHNTGRYSMIYLGSVWELGENSHCMGFIFLHCTKTFQIGGTPKMNEGGLCRVLKVKFEFYDTFFFW